MSLLVICGTPGTPKNTVFEELIYCFFQKRFGALNAKTASVMTAGIKLKGKAKKNELFLVSDVKNTWLYIMKSIKMFLSIFIAFSMFSNSGFADGKDKLETSINEFKIAFTDRLYGSLSWGMQHDADSMLHITDEIVSEHGIRGELIPFVSTLGEEYAAKGDVLSLLILATLCFHYVPNESRELILRYVMILQSAIFHAMKTTDKKELIFEQIKELFESMKPEKQSVFFEESRTVFSSISQGHYTGKLFTNQSGAYLLTFFPTPLLLIDALISTWTIKRGVSR